ncbi:hypothetical protein [Metabacillus sp. FJAT-52054]|uniref:Uncharacterized protein n=1 Tax=Metabacillus sediminis TaxID=3117746 RepID=A0ABZ2NJS9_9BACI
MVLTVGLPIVGGFFMTAENLVSITGKPSSAPYNDVKMRFRFVE